MDHLRGGRTVSCGCLRVEKVRVSNTTHGKSGARIYRIYNSMITRCTNKNRKSYKNYGGRGIWVCKEWSSFEGFYKWSIASGYSEALTIDRINNDKGYCPENCRWASTTIQARNKRKVKLTSSNYIGVSKAGKKWAARISVNRVLINLGNFENQIDAAVVRDNYIVENNLKGFTMNICTESVKRER